MNFPHLPELLYGAGMKGRDFEIPVSGEVRIVISILVDMLVGRVVGSSEI